MKIFKISNFTGDQPDYKNESISNKSFQFDPQKYHSEWSMISDVFHNYKNGKISEYQFEQIMKNHLSYSSVWRPYLKNFKDFIKQIQIHSIKISGL